MELSSVNHLAMKRVSGSRILFVLPSLGAGGSERVVTTLANHMAQSGRSVGVASFDETGFEPFYPLTKKVEVFRLNLPPASSGVLGQIWQTSRRIKALKEVYREFRPDVIISFLTKANVMALLAADDLGIPVIISERNNPTLQRFNTLWRVARARTYPKAFSFVTMTRGAADYYPPRQRPRTRIIPNPVNLPSNWQNRRQGNTITAVGRLAEQKQFHLLIEAFAKIASKFPTWNLVIWGEGALRTQLEQQRANLGLDDRISLPGVTLEPGQWIETADLLVLSSAYEGWPNVIVEGMAAGLPVVAFDCEHGVADMIEDGISGRLVPQDNVPALAEALESLLGNASQRDSFGKAALEASARFDTDAIANSWIKIIEEATASA